MWHISIRLRSDGHISRDGKMETRELMLGGLAGGALLLLALLQLFRERIPRIAVAVEQGQGNEKLDPKQHKPTRSTIPCYDPGSMAYMGTMPADSADVVREKISRARKASELWRRTSFRKRKLLLKVLQQYIIEHQDEICREASRDSGKPMVDAAFGEVMVTCEKIAWLIREGEHYLKPEKRSPGVMMFYKSARVEYHPLGVVGAIVPWNYPFHNVFNPMTAALFAGNALVIKVSEHASWSSKYYGRIISAALAAVGAPPDLVQIVTGYAEAGNALVTGGVNKVIFVGSTGVGKAVMQAAATNLTPVVLELGGKDAFIVCEDADLSQAVPTALRGAFQSCGQNCAGAERFLVHAAVYDRFVKSAVEVAKQLRQGHALGGKPVDCGAMCMPGLAEKVAELVEEAVQKGAQVLTGEDLVDGEAGGQWHALKVLMGVTPGMRTWREDADADSVLCNKRPVQALTGGKLIKDGAGGQFYAPTVLVGVTASMRIWREEVFGPVMVIVKCSRDDEAVRMANDCPFGLGSAVFSRSTAHARSIGARLEASDIGFVPKACQCFFMDPLQAGMTSINDFATTYMCQSLPFGGVKESGFDRFAGIEGIRGMCVPKAVCEDRVPWLMRTDIPPLLQYPVGDSAFPFVCGLISMFYGLSVRENFRGLCTVISCFVGGKKVSR